MRQGSRGFTLVELMVVIGIIALLVGMLFPSLHRAQIAAQQTACANNLREIGNFLMMYANDHDNRLPYIIEPIWKTDFSIDWSADPSLEPNSFINVMSRYTRGTKITVCPSYTLGYPKPDPKVTYRFSSANNYDGQPRLEEELFAPGGSPVYAYSLKYLDGRKYRLNYVDPYSLPLKLAHGAGPYYLARDFVEKDGYNNLHPPHHGTFNQLRLDLSVSFEKDAGVGFTYP